jgi:hypothetical protein
VNLLLTHDLVRQTLRDPVISFPRLRGDTAVSLDCRGLGFDEASQRGAVVMWLCRRARAKLLRAEFIGAERCAPELADAQGDLLGVLQIGCDHLMDRGSYPFRTDAVTIGGRREVVGDAPELVPIGIGELADERRARLLEVGRRDAAV